LSAVPYPLHRERQPPEITAELKIEVIFQVGGTGFLEGAILPHFSGKTKHLLQGISASGQPTAYFICARIGIYINHYFVPPCLW
jgi:hypothetical protein